MMPLKNARVTYPYGVKNTVYNKGYHTGIDLAATDYTVYAAVPGTIMEARYTAGRGADPNGWGNYIIFRTTDGRHDIIHAHLSAVKVMKGQKISEGTILGVMGSTGNSTGPHLHFEVRKAPWTAKNDINPAVFLGIKNVIGTVESIQDTKGDGEMIDNLVIYADGDTGTALVLSQKLGCPMVHKNSAIKYSATKKHWVGTEGTNDSGNVYYAGSNRTETAKAALK